MRKIVFENQNAVVEGLEKGKKMAIFEVDGDGNPIFEYGRISIKNVDISSKNKDIIRPAVKYIRENLNKELKLDMLAGFCDLSKSYFCKLFKESFGMGANEYIIRMRMEKACFMLEKTDYSVVSIAVEVGYAECSYFNRLFKKNVGCTPLEYRQHPKEKFLD